MIIMKPRRLIFQLPIWIALLMPLAAPAQWWARHPRYLRARTDLRRAHFLLNLRDEPMVMRDMHVADMEVMAAIHEVDVAAAMDRRDLDDNPPVDARLDRPGRFRE